MKLRLIPLLALISPVVAAQTYYVPMDKLPVEVRPFIEKGALSLAFEAADLNGDGLQDFVLVLEKQKAKASDPDIEENQRPLLILIRRPEGSMLLAARNEKIVYCSGCGGVFGDPFEGIKAGLKTFTVYHYGGSAWRWSIEYKFNYSRRDNTWQLVRVQETTYHASEPNKQKVKVYTPPKDYGKIDIGNFDPDNWKGQGAK
jgi:hypothetical protein